MRALPVRPRVRPSVLVVLLVAALIGILALIPVPYYLIGPGTAVDLRQAISVADHRPPLEHFYLTDVTLQHASLLLLPGALFPGVRLIPEHEIVPAGVAPRRYERILTDVMSESQDVAAVVAERAAGYQVPMPAVRVVVNDFTAASKATRMLRVGDRIVEVAGRPIRSSGEIATVISKDRPGTPIAVEILRDGRPLTVQVPTIATRDGTRFGIFVAARYSRPTLPIPVRYAIGNISGSSAGLMFALDIYRSLRPDRRIPAEKIAGTGTIGYDGTIGPIEGTVQKLIAAKRAGARLFLCPKENYRDVAGERDVRVIPVASFRDALRALQS